MQEFAELLLQQPTVNKVFDALAAVARQDVPALDEADGPDRVAAIGVRPKADLHKTSKRFLDFRATSTDST
ncbi:MAG: hypothetical protein WA970_07980 [Gammaproteobacteria bacterium]